MVQNEIKYDENGLGEEDSHMAVPSPSRDPTNTFGIRRRNVSRLTNDNDIHDGGTSPQTKSRHNNQQQIQPKGFMSSHHEQQNNNNDFHPISIHSEEKSSPTHIRNNKHLIPSVSNSSSSSTTVNNIHQTPLSPPPPPSNKTEEILYKYSKDSITGQLLTMLTRKLHLNNTRSGSALPGFLSLLLLTMANYMLAPMRDAAALAVGVSHIPTLTLASTILAIGSSVPVGWLFEAPNPIRWGKSWRDRVGLTRGETQGTSLALFLRCFAICLLGYALTFKALEWLHWNQPGDDNDGDDGDFLAGLMEIFIYIEDEGIFTYIIRVIPKVLQKFGKVFYVAFFLVVHLMKLHSMSLIWGVTSEAMEYEEQAETRERRKSEKKYHDGEGDRSDESYHDRSFKTKPNKKGEKKSRIRLKRLAFVGFGGTLGGIIGSVFVSMTAHTLRLSGLLIVAAILLFLTSELSIELGQIMLRHWEEEQQERLTSTSHDDLISFGLDGSGCLSSSNEIFSENLSSNDLHCENNKDAKDGGLNTIMIRSTSLQGMKRVASGMSISSVNSMAAAGDEVDTCMKKVSSLGSMKRVASGNSLASIRRGSLQTTLDINGKVATVVMDKIPSGKVFDSNDLNAHQPSSQDVTIADENSFKQRLLRGITTILRSRLLMTIFTYNALFATTTTLLSFQRAELVANRSSSTNSMHSDTAFLARINIISSLAVFALQISGMGAYCAAVLGQRGTLSLLPVIRMLGVSVLALWHAKAGGTPPNLTYFLVVDEFTKVINFAVAKPVRESLWRGLSNEARYEAKPIVDTLANRWGSGSAAFFMALLDRTMLYTGLGEELADGTKSLFGFPPLLILCAFTTTWWAFVSADLGNIRHRIDMELKKQL